MGKERQLIHVTMWSRRWDVAALQRLDREQVCAAAEREHERYMSDEMDETRGADRISQNNTGSETYQCSRKRRRTRCFVNASKHAVVTLFDEHWRNHGGICLQCAGRE